MDARQSTTTKVGAVLVTITVMVTRVQRKAEKERRSLLPPVKYMQRKRPKQRLEPPLMLSLN
ncbi:hypothetical protein E2C01_022241 [Portunus trituberculatus]|uniref:Uncharacterized protein n=1 Tax=Portunus trituberculatus TaxID=210409 RepID=A0A5B7E6R5_PORTR|nr:hypothetical protein [Portunus trituberculatus]